MAGFVRNAMLYLGLGPDDEYEDDQEAADAPASPRPVKARPAKAAAPRPKPVPLSEAVASGALPPPPGTRPAPPPATRPAPPPPAAARPKAAPPPPAAAGARPKPPPAAAARGPVVRPVQPVGAEEHGIRVTADVPAAKPRVAVRPVPANSKPHIVTPTHFNHSQEVADRFKNDQPVIVNLQGASRELARRIIDFSSGICYALSGRMEKVGNQVYLLIPANVEVSAEERRRLAERGLG